jgi:phage tail sheath protein FI
MRRWVRVLVPGLVAAVSATLLLPFGTATSSAVTFQPPVVRATTAVTLFLGQGSSSTRSMPISNMSNFLYEISDPSPTLLAAVAVFYLNGGGDSVVVSTPDEQPATLAAALDAVPSSTLANLFVVPSLGNLAGTGYDTVVSSLAALADRSVGMAILDPPGVAVHAMQASDDISPLMDLGLHLMRTVVPGDRTRRIVLYSSRFVADDDYGFDVAEGTLISVAALMAGAYATHDNVSGVWNSPAGPDTTLELGTTTPDEAGTLTNTQMGQLAVQGGVDSIVSSADGAPTPYGGRTLATFTVDYAYISSARTADYIQRSLTAGFASSVFSPTVAAQQQLIDAEATRLLTELWTEGGLQGAATSEAFQLNSTTTAQDVAAGHIRLQVLVSLDHPEDFTEIDIVVDAAKP